MKIVFESEKGRHYTMTNIAGWKEPITTEQTMEIINKVKSIVASGGDYWDVKEYSLTLNNRPAQRVKMQAILGQVYDSIVAKQKIYLFGTETM